MQVYLLYKKELDGTNLKTMPFGLIARIFLRGAGFRPTHREQRDEVASDWTAKRLTRGKSILAMPEGTSRHEGLILAKRKGLARLAMQGNYWVLPVAIPNGAHAISDGLSTWRSRFKTDKRHNIVVVYGKPFFLKDLGLNLHNDPTGEKATTEIMVRIGAMLPEHLRGFYASAVKNFCLVTLRMLVTTAICKPLDHLVKRGLYKLTPSTTSWIIFLWTQICPKVINTFSKINKGFS